MDRTVRDHIMILEQKLEMLNTKIMEEENLEGRNRLTAELRATESALTLFRSALEVESRIYDLDT